MQKVKLDDEKMKEVCDRLFLGRTLSYRIEYRNYVLNDISHEKICRPIDDIKDAYLYQRCLPSPTSSLYSKIELVPKIPKNISKFSNICIPCAVICHTASEIYSSMLFYVDNDDKLINIHLPMGKDHEIMCLSFKPINKIVPKTKEFTIINKPYEIDDESSIIDEWSNYISKNCNLLIFKRVDGEGILQNNELKLEPINKNSSNRFLSFKLSYKVGLYCSSIKLDNEQLENKCIRIKEKMRYKYESLKCPICNYNVCNTEGLYYHNIAVHPNYIMRCLYRNNKIIIEVNDKHNDDENVKSHMGNFYYAFSYTKKPKLTPSIYQAMLKKYEDGMKIRIPPKITNQMNVDLLINKNYYHSKDCVPISPSSLLVDSDYEEDDKYITDNWDVIDRIKDLSINEKMFMKIWNSFIYRESPISDSQIPNLCVIFMELFKECLIEKHLLCDAFLHFINMYHFGLMKKDSLEKICDIILENDENVSSLEVLVENVADKINSLQNMK